MSIIIINLSGFNKWGDNMSPRTGRPKSDNPKSTQITVRLDNETLDKMDKVATSNSETRVETIRRGINKLYSELKQK